LQDLNYDSMLERFSPIGASVTNKFPPVAVALRPTVIWFARYIVIRLSLQNEQVFVLNDRTGT